MRVADLQESVMEMHLVGAERTSPGPSAANDGEQQIEYRNEHHGTDQQERRAH